MIGLTIKNLQINYGTGSSIVKAVKNVSLDISKGEIYGLVGESGCGKSSLGKALVGLIKVNAGDIFLNQKKIPLNNQKKLKEYRKSVQMIFQDPYSSLNPRMQVGEALVDVMKVHNILDNRSERIIRAIELFKLVGLEENVIYRYPHQFSGGQRQRICIARALTLEPEFIIADEPVSALDVSVQLEILNLIRTLNRDKRLTFLFISHDLAVVRNLCSRVSVMHNGEIIESGCVKDVIDEPSHEYTKKLIQSVPLIK